MTQIKTFEYTKIIGRENIHFGRNVLIDDFVFIYVKNDVHIGSFVHIACFTSITGSETVFIGNYAAVSQGCRILTSTDDFKDWGFGNSTIAEEFRNLKKAPITIGDFCVIGANSVLLPGVTIGEGATVGANSVVTRDLEPWGVYIGNKKVGNRDKEATRINYQKFATLDESKQIGEIFK